MSIRIEIPRGIDHSVVAEFMIKHFGEPCDESPNETWFWSTGEYYEEPNLNYPNIMDQKCRPEGVRIWKNCSDSEQFYNLVVDTTQG